MEEGRVHVCRTRKGRVITVFRKPEAQVERVLRRRFAWVRSRSVMGEYRMALLAVALWMRERGYMQGVEGLEWDQAQEFMAEKAAGMDEERGEIYRKVLGRLPGVQRRVPLCRGGVRGVVGVDA